MNIKQNINRIKKYKIRHDAFEAMGLLILLLSFGFQYFSSDLQSISDETPIIKINDNILKLSSNDLDIIEYLNNPDAYKDNSLKNIEDRKSHLSDWSDIKNSIKEVEEQQNKMTYMYLSLYLLGSLIIVTPKLFPKLPFFRNMND